MLNTYVADFEATTNEEDCRVWAYGYADIYSNEWDYGNNIENFMTWLKQKKPTVYFHNLKYDGSFIVNWLLRNGWKYNKQVKMEGTFSCMINKTGQWYGIEIVYGKKGKNILSAKIYDSLKKLPFKIKEIAKAFKLDMAKGEIDYHKPREIGYKLTDEEVEYLKMDLFILRDALKIQLDQGLTGITNGKDALDDFKSILGKKRFKKFFPVVDRHTNEWFRKAYKGGFTWLNPKYKSVTIHDGIVFDVNSLYPSVMYNDYLPYGVPIEFEGKYQEDENYPLYLQHIRCEFELKENKIPTIQIKKNLMFKENEYLSNSGGEVVDLHVTNVDFEIIKEHYHLYDVEYVSGFKFKAYKGLFNEYIEKWTKVKMENEGAIRQLAKLMLNSLYGKFATNPNITSKIPYLKENEALGFTMGEEEFRDPVYTPIACFITAYARKITIESAQKCYGRFIYGDTDSIHLKGMEIPEAISHIIDDKKMGFWALEERFQKGKYARQKTYFHYIYAKSIMKEGEVIDVPCSKEESTTLIKSVKGAGMSEEVKDKVSFDEFDIGYYTSTGNLKQKQVKGGVVLKDSHFEIKG